MKMTKLDEVDREILKLLQEDGRMAYKDIAEKIGKSPATVKNRVEKLMSMGVIKRFVPLLDYKSLGFPVSVSIMIQAKPGKLDELANYLASKPNVNYVYEITGEYDILVVARFATEESFSDFIRELLDTNLVERTSSSLVVKIHKEDPRIPI